MEINASQELYDTIFYNLQKSGITVYEALPTGKLKLPYVIMGAVQRQRTNLKTVFTNKLSITIEVWGGNEQRKKVNEIITLLQNVTFITTKHFKFIQRLNDSDSMIMHDNSTNIDLLHGIINLTFNQRTMKGK